jgi:hypothetical protein
VLDGHALYPYTIHYTSHHTPCIIHTIRHALYTHHTPCIIHTPYAMHYTLYSLIRHIHRTPHTAHRTPHTPHRTPHTTHHTPHTTPGGVGSDGPDGREQERQGIVYVQRNCNAILCSALLAVPSRTTGTTPLLSLHTLTPLVGRIQRVQTTPPRHPGDAGDAASDRETCKRQYGTSSGRHRPLLVASGALGLGPVDKHSHPGPGPPGGPPKLPTPRAPRDVSGASEGCINSEPQAERCEWRGEALD